MANQQRLRLREILVWAETWQSLWLPDKLSPGGSVDLSIGVTHATVEPPFRPPWSAWARIVSRIVAARWAVVGVVFATRRPIINHRFAHILTDHRVLEPVPLCQRTRTNLTK